MIFSGIFFLFLHKNISCGYSLEAPQQGASNEYPQHMFLWRTGENYPRITIKYSSLPSPLGYSFEVPHQSSHNMLFISELYLNTPP